MRMDRNRLHIGTYILQPYARTQKHIQDLADCGLDFVVCVDRDSSMLDLFEQHRIGAIVLGIVPSWFGGLGENAGTMSQTNGMDAYEQSAEAFLDHPAIWGIDVGDEPSALDFPYYGKVIDFVNSHFKNQFAYLNLYPSYGMLATNTPDEIKKQLGTENYEQYIERYCKYVNTDYICCDYYPYSSNFTDFFNNLITVSNACRKYNRHFWIILQVNSHRPENTITVNQLRFQAYTALAFGAEVLNWACYTAGWWYNQVLDEDGNQTPQYNRLKQVNSEILALAEKYMRYNTVATHFVGSSDLFAGVSSMPIDTLHTTSFKNLKDVNGLPLIVGEMVSRSDAEGCALMLSPVGDPMDGKPLSYHIQFCVNGNCTVHAWNGKSELPVSKNADGSYSLCTESNIGVLLIAE